MVGSSHASRLAGILSKKRNVINLSKPGATISALISQLKKVKGTENDWLIFQGFGNDFIRGDYSKYGGKYHLESCEKLTIPQKDRMFESVGYYLEKFPGHVIVVDMIYRYLNCCHNPDHRYKGIFNYQKAINKRLYRYFSKFPNVQVLRHETCLGFGSEAKNIKYNVFEYGSKCIDGVHLFPKYYEAISEKILSLLASS